MDKTTDEPTQISSRSNENPYQVTRLVDEIVPRPSRVKIEWYRDFLFYSAVCLSFPPIPLFCWVIEEEPFVGPPSRFEWTCVAIAVGTFLFWIGWAILLVRGILINLFPSHAIWFLSIPCIAGGISLLVVYLFGFDQQWFR